MSGRPQAVSTVQVNNAEVIVTEWRFASGAETGRRHHGHNYVVVSLIGGTLLLRAPEGDRHAPLVVGQAYSCKVSVEHNVINTSAHEVAFAKTEIK